MKSWAAYSAIRLGMFVVVFVALSFTAAPIWVSALIAAVVSFCVSYLALGTLRDAVARDLAERRTRPAVDSDAEDF